MIIQNHPKNSTVQGRRSSEVVTEWQSCTGGKHPGCWCLVCTRQISLDSGKTHAVFWCFLSISIKKTQGFLRLLIEPRPKQFLKTIKNLVTWCGSVVDQFRRSVSSASTGAPSHHYWSYMPGAEGCGMVSTCATSKDLRMEHPQKWHPKPQHFRDRPRNCWNMLKHTAIGGCLREFT